jgi:hypothetical protein
MKAWLLEDFGLQNLHLRDVPTPVPQAGEPGEGRRSVIEFS